MSVATETLASNVTTAIFQVEGCVRRAQPQTLTVWSVTAAGVSIAHLPTSCQALDSAPLANRSTAVRLACVTVSWVAYRAMLVTMLMRVGRVVCAVRRLMGVLSV